jgi:hypothetical protein
MASKCPECKADVVGAQVSLRFNAMEATEDREDWPSFPVRAAICSKCGWMDLHMAKPRTFSKWLNLEKEKRHTPTRFMKARSGVRKNF